MRISRVANLSLCASLATLLLASGSQAQLRNPIYRVDNRDRQPTVAVEEHPLDPAIRIARDGLARLEKLKDYTAIVVKRERINGELVGPQYMFLKVRNRQVRDGETIVPFSVYMKFLKPEDWAGREVIYVEGKYDDRMVAHDVGWKNIMKAKLKPDGFMAMKGNRYPITHIGFNNMIEKLIEKGERDKTLGTCDVKFFKNAKVNGRTCTLIQAIHPDKKPEYDFHMVRIFIDDEQQIPLHYASYQWPETPGGEPVLDEEYTYMDVKLEVGLSDLDFDSENPAYNFPKRWAN